MTKLLLAFSAGILLVLVFRWGWAQTFSFRAQSPDIYADQTPEFDIRTALNGPMLAEGVIYNFAGRVSSRFTAKLEGNWNGNSGTLSEVFTYSTGTTQNRLWYLEVDAQGNIIGRAVDIVGQATGTQSGATVNLRYQLVLPEQAGGHVINVTDWMYLTANGTVVNRAEFRKFGLKVGELVATFRPATQ